MRGRDASAEALHRLLFGRTTAGYGVIGVAKPCGRRTVWERHALDVIEDADAWLHAMNMLIAHGLQSEVWPFACNSRVLRGIGSGAFYPADGRVLRSFQATVALVWATPNEGALARFADIGGHVIARGVERFGLLPLDEQRPLGELSNLTKEMATVLAAEPLGFRQAVPTPGIGGAEFVTDVATALTAEPVSGEQIALAGLRTQSMPWITAEVSA